MIESGTLREGVLNRPTAAGQRAQQPIDVGRPDDDIDIGALTGAGTQPCPDSWPFDVQQIHTRGLGDGLDDRMRQAHPHPQRNHRGLRHGLTLGGAAT